MTDKESNAEWKVLLPLLKPGVAESDENGVGDDAEGSDCAKERSRVRNAGENETICCEQSGEHEKPTQKIAGKFESGCGLGVFAPSPGLVHGVDFSFFGYDLRGPRRTVRRG